MCPPFHPVRIPLRSRAGPVRARTTRRSFLGPYLVGVDIGGTFTDCVVVDRAGRVTATKVASTPGNFAEA